MDVEGLINMAAWSRPCRRGQQDNQIIPGLAGKIKIWEPGTPYFLGPLAAPWQAIDTVHFRLNLTARQALKYSLGAEAGEIRGTGRT